ncbi:MAG: ABC transporter permease [Armatimonadota bacterium]|nr:ABC transporter permease [Armatimonadota bacterium]MDR7486109.1 ABC transporter permease [Armatimonadota bacterium]MDR7531740.1 ABC transporter permease [Armatimonadota bacterium]MDR7534916.1 ABC transporter permease [Armatimonadota bacterium]
MTALEARAELQVEAEEARATAVRDALLRATLLLGIGFALLPLVIVVAYSFSSVAYGVFPPPGLSLRWYANLLGLTSFRDAFVRSVVIALVATGLALGLGVLGALALVRGRFRGKELLRGFLLSPIVMPKIVLGVGWFIFFARLGLQGGLVPIVLAHTIVVLPFVINIVAANLVGLDVSLEEAAQDLGASAPTVLWCIVLPQIRSGVLVSGLLAFIVSFDQVESSIFLTRGENNTLPIEMFLYMEKWQDPTIAALSALLIAFAAVLVGAVLLTSRGADIRRLFPR